jgi:hypothetical protein
MASDKGCIPTEVSDISSSTPTDPSFPASAVLDNNPGTVWSVYGIGSWIEMDLGQTRHICNLDIGWYKGDQRQNDFKISASIDGKNFEDVISLKSSGTTNSFESYELQNVKARYLKITVNGNTQNDYATITGISVYTSDGSPSPIQEEQSSQPGSGVTQTAVSASDNCLSAKIAKATASGNYKSYFPANAIDGNAQTRWVNTVQGSWIKLYLERTQTICSIDIQWFKGDTRVYSFKIAVSKDNKVFKEILNAKSSGKTASPESYDLPDTSGRIIKLTVTANTENNYASIKEIRVKTIGSVPPPPPTPDGVKTIYQTKAGGETWFFNPNNPNDGQFDPNGASISKNSDGSWHLKPGTTRMLTFPKSDGLLSDQLRSNLPTYDYSELALKGYWFKSTDWKNTEVTGYFKVISSSDGDGISLVTRSVRHSNSIHEGCGGSSYHNNIRFDGTFQFKKEMWHVNYDTKPPTKSGIGSIFNKWVGFKGIVYNLPDGSVKLESYVDKDANNDWQKVQELVDSGNWGNDMTHCNAKNPGAQITWGSPMPIFKSTGVTYDFKKLSVREIVPPS